MALPVQAQHSPAVGYENSTVGLRQQIREMAAAYQAGDAGSRSTLLKSVDFPDAPRWFARTFGPGYGAALAREYARLSAQRVDDLQSAFAVMGAKPGVKAETFTGGCSEHTGAQKYPLLALRAAGADTLYEVRLSRKEWSGALWFFAYVDGRFRYTGRFDLTHEPIRSALFEAFQTTTGAHPSTEAGMQPVVLVHQESPQYPKQASRRGVEGRLLLWAVIRTDGTAGALLPLVGSCWFAQSATDSVRRWRFRPAQLNGRPVEMVTSIELNFGFRARQF
jgi:hypothetical protein